MRALFVRVLYGVEKTKVISLEHSTVLDWDVEELNICFRASSRADNE